MTDAMGGDNDGDDKVAMSLWGEVEHGGTWQLEGWHKSPERMQAEAAAMNAAGFASANSGAGKHSQGRLGPNRMRRL
jgi:hypothetical protein